MGKRTLLRVAAAVGGFLVGSLVASTLVLAIAVVVSGVSDALGERWVPYGRAVYLGAGFVGGVAAAVLLVRSVHDPSIDPEG